METIRRRIKTLRRVFEEQYGSNWVINIKNNIECGIVTFTISNYREDCGVIVDYDRMINYSMIDLINYINQFFSKY